jgi:hypothetical protein
MQRSGGQQKPNGTSFVILVENQRVAPPLQLRPHLVSSDSRTLKHSRNGQ